MRRILPRAVSTPLPPNSMSYTYSMSVARAPALAAERAATSAGATPLVLEMIARKPRVDNRLTTAVVPSVSTITGPCLAATGRYTTTVGRGSGAGVAGGVAAGSTGFGSGRG